MPNSKRCLKSLKLIFIIAVLAMAVSFISWANAREIGFIEDFMPVCRPYGTVKTTDLPESLNIIIIIVSAFQPGDFEQVHTMLGLWIRSHCFLCRSKEILNRQALLELSAALKNLWNI